MFPLKHAQLLELRRWVTRRAPQSGAPARTAEDYRLASINRSPSGGPLPVRHRARLRAPVAHHSDGRYFEQLGRLWDAESAKEALSTTCTLRGSSRASAFSASSRATRSASGHPRSAILLADVMKSCRSSGNSRRKRRGPRAGNDSGPPVRARIHPAKNLRATNRRSRLSSAL